MIGHDFDIIVIGGGCIGSSIAFQLAKKGFKNIALIDNGRKQDSATARSGGLLRVFHESAEHVELALKHHEQAKELQSQKILSKTARPNGSLYFFDRRRFRDYETNLEKMETHGYPFEVITAKTGQLRFPQFHWSADQWAIFEPQGSHMSPNQFCDELLHYSERNGLSLIENFEVERICFFRDRYRLFSRGQSVYAKTLILAGGARLIPQLRELGIGHTLKAQELKVFKSRENFAFPTLPNFFDRETLQYAGIVSDEKLVISHLTTDRLNQSFNSEKFQEVSGLDCYAPQRAGHAGVLTGQPRLLLATGWGGTAFKFSLEIGQRMALALENQTLERTIFHA